MKRFVGLAIVFSGMMFSFFLINIVLYMYNPAYHSLLEEAVKGNNDIPVIDVKSAEVKVNSDVTAAQERPVSDDHTFVTTSFNEDKEEVPLSFQSETDKQPVVVSKEYHEDCGSGKGYWVLTYEDGSVVIE